MAFSAVTERGSNNTKSSGTTLDVSPSANLTVGKIVFAQCVSDNFALTNGATTEHTSVTDTHTHTWNKVFERTRTAAGVANDGVTHSLWWTKVTTQIGTGDSVTLTIANARNVRVIALFEVSITGSTIQKADDGTPEGFHEVAGTSATASTSGMTSQEYLHLGLLGREADVLTWTEDADYTNVYASEGIASSGGGAGTNQSVFAAYRIATLTGDTFAVSWVGSTDVSLALVAFEEVSSGGQSLTGTLFTKAPTFFTGTVTSTRALTGTLFTNAPSFFTGTISLTTSLTGTLFQNTPTFFTGAISVGAVTLSGTLFQNTPTFPTGIVALDTDQTLTGTLFQKAPTFFGGTITTGAVTLSGTLFQNAPTFNAGTVTSTRALTGTLFQKAPTFFTGRVRRAVPTGLAADEIGAMGHSIPNHFVTYYRTISSRDLIPAINHGGINAKAWGDPADAGYTAAWAKIAADEPAGGYRAFWIMLGYAGVTGESDATMQGWANHIIGRLLSDYPTIEYLWWSPQATYFETNPGDGDAEDLVAIDRWGTNPLGLTEHASANAGEVLASQKSWDVTQYVIANNLVDDYGPWVNLTEDLTDPDGRHPSDVAGGDPLPNGQSHGGDIVLAFFEQGTQGLAGELFVKTPTFFTGTITAGSVALTGTLFQNTPSFFAGLLQQEGGPQLLGGNLFQKAPTFPTGTVSPGSVALTGTLFTNAPAFPQGSLSASYTLAGVLFQSTPGFFTGVLIPDQLISGVLFQNTPVFPQGTLSTGTLEGVLFQNTPVFFVGVLTQFDRVIPTWPVSTTAEGWPVSTQAEWQGV